MKKNIILLLLIFQAQFLFAQTLDEQIFKEKILLPKGETKAQTTIILAKSFMGKPYIAATLEGASEKLVCNLREFDCFTLVENVVAVTLTKQQGKSSYTDYKKYLQNLRYRNGVINGYPSRIHYFSEWVTQAEQNSFIEDMTKHWGIKSNKAINFMSNHRNLYSALANNDNYSKIIEMEASLLANPFYEIPKSNLAKVESKIKDGDIIVFTSTVNGLDVNHEGFAIHQNGELHLLHASLDQKKVIISTETLGEYLNKIKKHQGIMVLRLR